MKASSVRFWALLAMISTPTLPSAAGLLVADEKAVIGSRANTNIQTVIGLIDGPATVVRGDGSLTYDRFSLSFRLDREESMTPTGISNRILDDSLPAAVTEFYDGNICYSLTALTAPLSEGPADLLNIALHNTGEKPARARLEVEFDSLLPEVIAGDSGLLAGKDVLCRYSPPSKVNTTPRDWGNTTPGAESQLRWANPAGTVDRAFANIRVGWNGSPIEYLLKVQPGKSYVAYLGLCEGYWTEAGHRVLDLSVEGGETKIVDTFPRGGHNKPFVEHFTARDTDGDGFVKVRVIANSKAGDMNSILNVIWLFDQAVEEDALVNGKLSNTALYYIDVGGPGDRSFYSVTLEYRPWLKPGEEVHYYLAVPRTKSSGSIGASEAKWTEGLEALRQYWSDFHSRGASFRTPEPVVNQLYAMSLANILLARDRVGDVWVVHPGRTVYHNFWYRDGSYMCIAQDMAGYPDEAEKSLRLMWWPQDKLPESVRRFGQQEDGLWCSPFPKEYDGQGQALWALLEHYRLTADKDWLAKVFPAIRRGVSWNREARARTLSDEPLTSGLYPEGMGEAIETGHIYYHDFWGVLGMREALRAAEVLGRSKEGQLFRGEYEDFLRCVTKSVGKSFTTVGKGQYIPGDPFRADIRIWGSLAALWPCRVFDPRDEKLTATLRKMEDRSAEGMYQFITNPKIWPYISTDWAQGYLLRDETDKAVDIFYSYIDHAAVNRAWIEEIFLDSRIGTGDMPHCWAAADFVILLRNMLLREEDGELLLASGTPRKWLADGLVIKVDRAPTHFGQISYRITSCLASNRVKARIEPPARTVPGKLRLRLRLPDGKRIVGVSVDGKPWDGFDGEWITLPSSRKSINVVAEVGISER